MDTHSDTYINTNKHTHTQWTHIYKHTHTHSDTYMYIWTNTQDTGAMLVGTLVAFLHSVHGHKRVKSLNHYQLQTHAHTQTHTHTNGQWHTYKNTHTQMQCWLAHRLPFHTPYMDTKGVRVSFCQNGTKTRTRLGGHYCLGEWQHTHTSRPHPHGQLALQGRSYEEETYRLPPRGLPLTS